MPTVTFPFPRTALAAISALIAILVVGPPDARATAAATTTTLTISAGATPETSVSSGTAVTLTATVKTGSTPVQTGLVNFCNAAAAHCTDIHIVGVAQLTAAGTAAFKFIPGPGTHSYKAEFRGTATDAASASAASPLTVNAAPSTTTIAQSGSTGNYTLKATVAGIGSVIAPTGTVSFLDTSNANAVLGSASLVAATPSLTWSTPQSPATKPSPQSIAVADFNGDGIPDIAIGTNATTGVGYIQILLGNGDGTFQTAKTFTALPDNQAIVAAPFVNGGPVDILTVSNNTGATNNAVLLVGDGTGNFTPGAPFSLGGTGTISSLIAGDFNGDGKQDFIVGGVIFGVDTLDTFLGNGNGTFGTGTLNATSTGTIAALGAGDFTGAGALDLAVVHTNGTVDVFLQDGLGDFFPNAGTNAGNSPTAIAVGDFNGDGKADLAIANGGGDNVSIRLGDGAGNFAAAASPTVGSSPSSIAMGDFNGDGIVDLAVANSGGTSVTILLGKGDGTFTAETPLTTGNTPIAIAEGNFNNENTASLAIANQDPAGLSASTATILLAKLTQTTTATATGIAPSASGAHLVDAGYAGDTIYHSSVSATTSINGSGAQAAAPILSPAAGTYAASQAITLTDSTPGATIYYTTNGATPTTASTKYTAPFTLAATETVRAIAAATGYSNSITASATYTVQASTLIVSFTPASLAFPSTAVGATSPAQTVTIINTGTAAVTLTSETIVGGNSASFVKSATTCGATLAATASCTVSVEFKPVPTGALASTLSVADNATGSPQIVTLTGTSTAASGLTVSLTPTSLAFASATVGSTSAAQSVTIKNTGTAAVTLTSETITGTNATSFVKSATTCGATLAASTTCTVSIEFKPTVTGSLTASLSIADNATGTPQTVALTGTGTASSGLTIALTPASLAFPSTAVGATSAAQTATVTNTGTAAVTLTSETIVGGNSASFVKSATTCGATLAVAASCTVSVEFKPVPTGALASTLSVADNATGSPQIVTLTGTSTAASGLTVSLTPANLAFASATVGSTSAAQSVTVKNTGTAAVTLTSETITGTNATSFVKSATTCGATLAAAATCTVSVEFKPAATGSLTGSLSIADNATGSPQTVALTGTATAGSGLAISLSPASVAFPSTAVGATSPAQTVTVTNTGTAAVTLTSETIVGGNSASFVKSATTCAATLAATASCTVSVEFKPVPTGALSSTLSVADNATGSPQTVALTGTSTAATAAAAPTFSVPAGVYTTTQSVALSDTTSGATIYYTTDGSTPTTTSPRYTAPISVTVSETIKAIAVATGFANSAVATAIYTISLGTTAVPVLSPVPGVYSGAQTVTITDATPSAVITYTLGIGNTTQNYTYTAPFTISSSEYIVYDAIAPGYTRSDAPEGFYTIGSVPAPVFSVPAGTYTSAQTVSISDDTPTAVFYYTTNGTTPTTSSTKYTAPITVSASETLKAIATAPGVTNSPAASAAYVIGTTVATPIISPAGGSYTTAQAVTITDTTPSSTIYFTTNGSAPTTASTKYTAAIPVASSETIKAIAVATGLTNSAIATSVFTIGLPIETLVATSSGTNSITIPFSTGQETAFVLEAGNGGTTTYPTVVVSSSTGSNNLPITVLICQTDSTTGQCLAAPSPTVTLTSFAPNNSAVFSVFVTASAAISSSPSNVLNILFQDPSHDTLGLATVTVDTD